MQRTEWKFNKVGEVNMPDITMCSSEQCPMKDKCYRTTAKSSKYQSWSNFEYTCHENNGHEDFIPDRRK